MVAEVYEVDDVRFCYFCEKNEPEEGKRVYLCDPAHTPCNGEPNYVCEDHLDSDADISSLEDQKNWET